MQGLLTSKEVAALLGVSTATLSRWRASGDGPPVLSVRGVYRYRPALIEKWIKENER
jgi:predicted site-specific integrase-resolvase